MTPTTIRSLLALVVSAALVLGALWVHGDLDGGGGNTRGGRAPRLLCATELSDVCEAIARSADVEIILEPAGTSVSRLATLPDDEARDPGFDGWLAPAPAAEIVRDARSRAQLAPLLDRDIGKVAESRLLLAVWKDRERVLDQGCNGKLDWRCVGDAAGRRWSSIGGDAAWGNVKPGHENPEATAIGLDVIGQAASEYFGKTDLSTDDYADDGFLEWFSRLERAVRPSFGASAFEQMLAAGPAAFDVVGTTDAEARPLLAHASADRRRAVDLLYPAPVARVDVLFATVNGFGRADDLRGTVDDAGRAALEQAGWDVSGKVKGRNLPDPGSLEALLDTWREVTG